MSHTQRNACWERAAKGGGRTPPTDDIDVGVGEDGAVSVGGLALVDGRVAEVDVLQDQGAAGGKRTPGVLVQLCRERKSTVSTPTR